MRGPYGRFKVVGRRRYRGHEPGTEFEAMYDPALERAVGLGTIELLEWITPAVVEGSYRLPPDWPPPMANVTRKSEAPEGASFVR